MVKTLRVEFPAAITEGGIAAVAIAAASGRRVENFMVGAEGGREGVGCV